MYAAHFGLKDQPFSITPDPAYLFMSPHHQEALAHLLYGTGDSGGFVQLTGEVGTGKTTLVRTLAEQRIDRLDVALCLNPRLTVVEFVAALCDELGVDYPREATTLKPLVDALNRHLLATHARGRRTVLIIDEAQNLSREVLEQVRLLTNLETHKHKLLRIILVGQPELQKLLNREDMRQLAQRITARYHLMPLGPAETRSYILHRLRIGGAREGLFTAAALRAAHRLSRGIPRLINIICDRALLAAYVQGHGRVDGALLRQAAREALRGGQPWRPPRWLGGFASGLAATLLLGIGIWWSSADLPSFLPRLPLSGLALSTATIAEPDSSPGPAPAPAAGTVIAMVDDAVSDPVSDPDPPAATPPMALAAAGPPSPGTAFIDSIEAAASPVAETPRLSTSPPTPIETESAVTPPDADYLLARLESPALALGRLLAVWENRAWEGTPSDCESLRRWQLMCLEGNGDLDELRRFNRPAILNLASGDGRVGEVLLRVLDDDEAVLAVAGDWLGVPLAELERLWTGQYLLLWRPQTELDLIGLGDAGEAVNWLRQRLALDDNGPGPVTGAVYDQSLAARVRDFQRRHGLQADGLVGARTMTLLNNLQPAPGTPLLTRGG